MLLFSNTLQKPPRRRAKSTAPLPTKAELVAQDLASKLATSTMTATTIQASLLTLGDKKEHFSQPNT
jgi:hypothetical protein